MVMGIPALGGELTFAMSSIYALAGLLLVAKWVKEATIVEPEPELVVDTSGEV